MKRVWNKEEIKNLIATRDDAVIRGLICIYRFQTNSEQVTGYTSENNGVGFSGADSEILTSFVRFYNKNKYLSPKQLVIARKKMLKYSRQLMLVANN